MEKINSYSLNREEKIFGKSILIVGIVKNIEKTIKEDYFRMKTVFSSFNNLCWYLVESDSNDGSINALNELSKLDSNFNFENLGHLQDIMPKRTERLAFVRNRYLKVAREKFSHFDYLVVADFNNLNRLLTTEKITNTLQNERWDVVTANQEGPYYDIWALRHHLWSPNDCWKAHAFYRNYVKNPEKALFSTVNSRMIKIPKSSDWINVDSAFGGFAIYKMELALVSSYSGLDSAGDSVCEHVPFHYKIISNGGKIYINPSLTNMKLTDHSKRSRTLYKIGRFLLYPYKFAVRKKG